MARRRGWAAAAAHVHDPRSRASDRCRGRCCGSRIRCPEASRRRSPRSSRRAVRNRTSPSSPRPGLTPVRGDRRAAAADAARDIDPDRAVRARRAKARRLRRRRGAATAADRPAVARRAPCRRSRRSRGRPRVHVTRRAYVIEVSNRSRPRRMSQSSDPTRRAPPPTHGWSSSLRTTTASGTMRGSATSSSSLGRDVGHTASVCRVFPPLGHTRLSDQCPIGRDTVFWILEILWKVAGPTGLEPATSGVTGQRSNQLNYDPAMGNAKCERNTGQPAGLPAVVPNVNSAGLPAVVANVNAAGLPAVAPKARRLVGGTGLEPVTAGV